MIELDALINKLLSCEEYQAYIQKREIALKNQHSKAMYEEYRRLRLSAQANEATGVHDELLLQKLQKLGELLHMEASSSEFLIAEYKLNMLVNKIIGSIIRAMDADASFFE